MNDTNSETDVPPVDLDPMRASVHRPLAEDAEPARCVSRIRRQGSSANDITAVADSSARAKARLKEEFPSWNFICSQQGRWWAQRFPVPRELFNKPNMIDADTAAGLRAKLAEATS